MTTPSKKEKNNPICIGLTGGIGSGKSTVAKIFQSLGVPVFNSDIEGKKILNTDQETINAVKIAFGSVYLNNKIDTQKLAKIVFKDQSALQKLNSIVHPKVKEAFEDWKGKHKKSPFLLKEAAILVESGIYKELDGLIVVTAPKDIRVKRVIKRDGSTTEKVLERINAQLLDSEIIKFSNYRINNNGNKLVIPQVLRTYQELLKK